ncbi:carbohydrate-binding domain-containing protein, partial [uncultured Adlercreutzia sp.]|uniref:carbohydrate-binding domain-containing protein n=1 Tax=uncultured Adlercreutzia sp. TaxID=875803 RepID=UPI002674C456
MRKTHQHRLLRGAMAAVLACGLMMPTTALTAFADEENTPTPPLASEIDSGGFDAAVSDAGAGEPADGEADASAGTAAESAAHAASLGVQYLGRAAQVADGSGEPAPASATLASESEPAAQSNTVTLGGLTMVGEGIQASDFTLAGNLLTINTDAPFIISGTSTATTLVVPAGVQAHITLDGLSISSSATPALDIKAGGEAHLVLADGKSNALTSTNGSWPGLHCGTGAVLTIDDEVPNVDVSGNLITPEKGQIPAGTVYVDNTGVTRTSEGDYLTLIDSLNPGILTVKGGTNAAALGGAWGEDGGSMTFNGGILNATNPDSSGGGGAGIGGGRGAAGTSPDEWITINGGRITAQGGYHGAGIGGGYNQSVTLPTGLTKSTHPGGTGNVRINGGYTESNGGAHGNGFGRACYGSCNTCDNRDYTILITGGTMIPKGGTDLATAMDIGGAGTKPPSSSSVTDWAANVVISGGSVKVSTTGGKFRFDGVAYGSYTEDEDGKITPNRTDQVELITINLTKDLEDLTPEGETVNLDRTITSWTLLVGGEEVGYGAPAQFNEGFLYLWLTPDQAAQQVTVQLSYEGPDGSPVPVEPLYRPAGGTGGDTNLKRYVFFDLQDDFFDQAAADGSTGTAQVPYDALSTYEQRKYGDTKDENGMVTVPVVKKKYDGLSYQVKELSEDDSISSGGDDNKPIWDKISYLIQVYDAETGKLGAEQPSDTTPSDTGLSRFTMTSTQYSGEPDYKESYYGHRAYGWCEITPVPAVVKIAENDGAAWVRLSADGSSYEIVKETDSEPGNRLRLAFDIRSAKGTAVTCKAPTGRFQVMIDGQPVGDPIDLTEEVIEKSLGSSYEVVSGEEGRETVRVVYYLDPTNLD